MSEITKEWLDDVYRRQPYTWDVPDTDLFLYQQKSGYYQGLTMICRHEPDGDETDLCYVADQEQLVRMLSLHRHHAASRARWAIAMANGLTTQEKLQVDLARAKTRIAELEAKNKILTSALNCLRDGLREVMADMQEGDSDG